MSIIETIPLAQPDPPVEAYQTLYVPQSAHLRLSAACNLACPMCERESWKRGELEPETDMALPVWERIKAHYLPSLLGVELSGLGEPTLHKDFPRIAKEIVGAGKTLYFPTNGSTLAAKRVLESVGEKPSVSVSLDAWDAESYTRMRPGLPWERVLKAVKTFRRAKPQATLHSQYTASRKNIDGLPRFIEVAAGLGIGNVLMRFVQNHAEAREDLSLTFARDRTEAAIDAARAVAEREGIWFEAERRPYASQNANNASPAPLDRLRRYLDFNILDIPDPGSSGFVCFPFGGGTSGSISPITAPTGNGPLDFGQPIIIRSPRRERTAQAQAYAPASLIVAADGDLWTCFARHSVGNVFTHTLEDVVTNPRYQAFLQNRFTPAGMRQEAQCRNCSRVY